MTAARARRSRHARRWAIYACWGVLAVAVAVGTWVGVRGALAAQHLLEAKSLASTVQSSISKDPAGARAALSQLEADASEARALTSDPIWSAASHLPWIGPQLHAVSTLATALHATSTDVIEPLVSATDNLNLSLFTPKDGAIDLTPVAALAQPSAGAATAAAQASAEVNSLDRSALLPALRAPVTEASDLLSTVAEGTDALRRTTALLPAMLGADGPRNYLLMFQNPAELRTLGGIAGALALVHTDHGKITFTVEDIQKVLPNTGEPVTTLDAATLALFSEKPATYYQNITSVPDFATAAQLLQDFWKRTQSTPIDGVISADPVALSYLLSATGPLSLRTGDTLSADNAVQLLLNEVYLRYGADTPAKANAQQNAFFAVAATAVFNALSSGKGDPAKLIDALGRAGSERRLLIASNHPTEQAVLDGTLLQGTLPEASVDQTPVAMYLMDTVGSKIDYYLQVGADVSWCGAPAVNTPGTASLNVTLTSTVPADGATALPWYITGGGAFGTAPGIVGVAVTVYLPSGMQLAQSASTSTGAPITVFSDRGRTVLRWNENLAPQGKSAVSIRLASDHASAPLSLVATPTIYPIETSGLGNTCG
ncbi:MULTISPECIES: DUF4012 domain-containing protein [Microbacterium]|uniref:DUF4012 domain-containing protein n=1 Tax=Microbacterium TaxID=33882 RepID=UPI0010FA293D|nr:DUF4012 domain-containing protein [Microbacterium sp. 4NA327F11]MCK9919814.1 DUF4012 domain-containing protein [Microbacteriaceae bacterium K1510]